MGWGEWFKVHFLASDRSSIEGSPYLSICLSVSPPASGKLTDAPLPPSSAGSQVLASGPGART